LTIKIASRYVAKSFGVVATPYIALQVKERTQLRNNVLFVVSLDTLQISVVLYRVVTA